MVCVRFGICSTEYFLDKMKTYELNAICESMHLKTKDNWEQARLIAYIVAQTNSSKRLKPTDIIKFGWEQNTSTSNHHQSLTAQDVEQIKLMALQREKELKEKGII